MKNKIIIIVLCIVLVVVIGGAYLLYNVLDMDKMEIQDLTQTPNQENQVQGENDQNQPWEPTLAPDFTVYDTEGKSYKLSDFQGKPVVLNYWASWCYPCKSEMPVFEKAYEKYGENIHFLMINMTDGYQETVAKAEEFIGENGYTFPVYFDTEGDAARANSVYSIPTTFFIDKDGYGIAMTMGSLDEELLEQGIDMIYE